MFFLRDFIPRPLINLFPAPLQWQISCIRTAIKWPQMKWAFRLSSNPCKFCITPSYYHGLVTSRHSSIWIDTGFSFSLGRIKVLCNYAETIITKYTSGICFSFSRLWNRLGSVTRNTLERVTDTHATELILASCSSQTPVIFQCQAIFKKIMDMFCQRN